MKRLSVAIPIEWETVVREGVPLKCHDREFKSDEKTRHLFHGPKIYRWLVRARDGSPCAAYIGETGNFSPRFSKYKRGHRKLGDTVNFVRNAFEQAEASGATIELQFLKIIPFKLNGLVIDDYELNHPTVRKLLENLCLITARMNGLRLLNRDKSINQKYAHPDLAEMTHQQMEELWAQKRKNPFGNSSLMRFMTRSFEEEKK